MKSVTKRFSCLLLIACMLFSSFSVVQAATPESQYTTMYNAIRGGMNGRVYFYVCDNCTFKMTDFWSNVTSVKSSNTSIATVSVAKNKRSIVVKTKKSGKVKITVKMGNYTTSFYVMVNKFKKPRYDGIALNNNCDTTFKLTAKNTSTENKCISYRKNASTLYMYVSNGNKDYYEEKGNLHVDYASAYSTLKVSVDGKVVMNKKIFGLPSNVWGYKVPIQNKKGKHKVVVSFYGTTKTFYVNVK